MTFFDIVTVELYNFVNVRKKLRIFRVLLFNP